MEYFSTFRKGLQFTAAVFVAGAIIGTIAQFLPVLNQFKNGIALTR